MFLDCIENFSDKVYLSYDNHHCSFIRKLALFICVNKKGNVAWGNGIYCLPINDFLKWDPLLPLISELTETLVSVMFRLRRFIVLGRQSYGDVRNAN